MNEMLNNYNRIKINEIYIAVNNIKELFGFSSVPILTGLLPSLFEKLENSPPTNV